MGTRYDLPKDGSGDRCDHTNKMNKIRFSVSWL